VYHVATSCLTAGSTPDDKHIPYSLDGSAHSYKYRLAFVVDGVCALRYDNESGKGDHRHTLDGEARYRFVSLDRLFADFDRDIRRFLHEDRNT